MAVKRDRLDIVRESNGYILTSPSTLRHLLSPIARRAPGSQFWVLPLGRDSLRTLAEVMPVEVCEAFIDSCQEVSALEAEVKDLRHRLDGFKRRTAKSGSTAKPKAESKRTTKAQRSGTSLQRVPQAFDHDRKWRGQRS